MLVPGGPLNLLFANLSCRVLRFVAGAVSDAMREVYRNHSDDPIAAALFAESLMILRPWKQWRADGVPAPETPEIVSVLESALAKVPNHPALCHLYIHTLESSPMPNKIFRYRGPTSRQFAFGLRSASAAARPLRATGSPTTASQYPHQR